MQCYMGYNYICKRIRKIITNKGFILKKKYRKIFTEEEIKMYKERLKEYGYVVDK